MSLVALVREPSTSLADCELTWIDRTPIDLRRARAQHAAYRAALGAAGAVVRVLPALDRLPDAAFVEDTALVLDEVAVLGALGTPSRASEPEQVAPMLETLRPLWRLDVTGATLEGGDVLRVDRTLYVGRSGRTNEAGVEALASRLEPLGYRIRALPVQGCLHLKTACTLAGDGIVVLNPAWVDPTAFTRDGLEAVPIASAEPWAANTLRVGGTLLIAAGNPVTRDRLRGAGLRPEEVDIGEFRKAEAGLTCLSLVIDGGLGPSPGAWPDSGR